MGGMRGRPCHAGAGPATGGGFRRGNRSDAPLGFRAEAAMPDDLYDRDILAWSIAQAERLRRVAAGERANDVDWVNAIAEIESVGRSEARSGDSLLTQAMVHALKVAAWPDHMAARKWRNEITAFL